MPGLVCHIVSGDAFFSGLLCVAVGLALLWLKKGSRSQRAGRLLIISGWLLAIVSLIPGQLFLTLLTFAWSVWAFADSLWQPHGDRHCPVATGINFVRPGSLLRIAGIVIVLLLTWPHEDRIESWHPGETVHVIGDSLSAGLDEGEGAPWPRQLGDRLKVDVVSHAVVGATARSAVKQVEALPPDSFVLVEIGGNDLLGGRSSADFRADLDELLSVVCRNGRRVVMFELPLPPFYVRYGVAQHELASRHGVTLIPRRVLARVLFSNAATLDSIHLTEAGHRRLAKEVARRLTE